MSIPLTDVVYPLDTSGLSPSNKIVNERRELTTTTWNGFNLVIPKAAPFFDDSISHLIHYPSGARLERGRDWITGWMFQSATGEIGQFVSACIYIFDTNLKGSVEIPSYQCLGGEWQLDVETLRAILAEKLLNPQRYYWEYVAKVPNIFRPLDHDEDIDSFSELGELLDSLPRIARAITAASETGSLELHIAQRNPHLTGPGDLTYPLDLLRNWNPATLLEMVDPNNLPTDRYMTPPATKRLIDNTAVAQLAIFAARRDNPNNVTARQTGTLTELEINNLIQEYLTGGGGNLNAATLEGRNLEGVVTEVALRTEPILKASYDALYAEIQVVLANVQANDTAKFAGLSQAQWDQRIEDHIEAQSTRFDFEAVQELLFPEWPEEGEVLPDIRTTLPTTTLIASITIDTAANRANTGLVTVIIDHVVYGFTIHALTREVTGWANHAMPAGYRFFLDRSGTADEVRLWMVAPAGRVGAVVINTNTTSTVISDGTVIFDAQTVTPPIINQPVDVVMNVHASVGQLETLATTVSTHGQAIANQGQFLTELNTAVTGLVARQQADLLLVNGISNIPANSAVEFNLTTLLQAAGKTGQFDLSKAVVFVRVKNTDEDSPNYNSWNNAEAYTSFGMRANLTSAFVYNHTAAALLGARAVSVPKS